MKMPQLILAKVDSKLDSILAGISVMLTSQQVFAWAS